MNAACTDHTIKKKCVALIYFEVSSPFISVHLYLTAILKINYFGMSLQIQQLAKLSHMRIHEVCF